MKKLGPWLKGLSIVQKALLTVGAIVLLGIAGSSNTPSTSNTSNKKDAPSSTQTQAPKIEKKTVTETQEVPFDSTTVESSSLTKGTTQITTAGVNGVKTLTYTVTYTDGTQTNKQLLTEEVTTPPVTQVTTVGTYVAPQPKKTTSNCDPNYSGACVPNVYPSDVDCAGGSGNGPYYVAGPVYVIGVDHYGLDRDGDGVACE